MLIRKVNSHFILSSLIEEGIIAKSSSVDLFCQQLLENEEAREAHELTLITFDDSVPTEDKEDIASILKSLALEEGGYILQDYFENN